MVLKSERYHQKPSWRRFPNPHPWICVWGSSFDQQGHLGASLFHHPCLLFLLLLLHDPEKVGANLLQGQLVGFVEFQPVGIQQWFLKLKRQVDSIHGFVFLQPWVEERLVQFQCCAVCLVDHYVEFLILTWGWSWILWGATVESFLVRLISVYGALCVLDLCVLFCR